jgi:predicted ATP-grasp superfamily ATP-dependent carboligase
MDFGHASTFAETISGNDISCLGEKFLRAIGYYGIAEVEFMYDERDGHYKLIEVNPRIWGWHALAEFAGVDLLKLLYVDMTGANLSCHTEGREAQWVRLITDLPTVMGEILRGRMGVMEYFQSLSRGTRDAVLSLRDPLPFLVEIALIPYLWVKRGF